VCKGILVVMKATLIGNLYKLEGSTQVTKAKVVSKEARESTCLWYQRLGHMSKKELGLQVLVNYKLFPELQSLNFCKFNIFFGYSDGDKGFRFSDPTANKIITNIDIHNEQLDVVEDRKGRSVCKLGESFYGLKVPRKWYKMFDSFTVSQNCTRSEYDHCVYFKSSNGIFIILVLYVDDMFVAIPSMV
jgi:hypothetical protein